MFKKLGISALALLIGATTLSAAELYLGAGFAGEVDSGSFRDTLEEFTETDGNAWKAFAGLRIGDHLALEAAWHDLGRQLCCRQIADLGFTSEIDGVSAAALARWPFRRVVPFAKVGVLSWSEDGEFVTLLGPSPRSADGTDLLLGAGLEVDLPASFGIRAEWERYEFEESSTGSVWVSVLFRF